jgi:hypothetical protein
MQKLEGNAKTDPIILKKGSPLGGQKHLRHQLSCALILSFFLPN